jgi:signal transduction histidine kinase
MSAANQVQSPQINTSSPIDQQQVTVMLRGVAVAAIVGAFIMCIVYMVSAIRWVNAPFAGFMYAYTMVVDGNQGFGGEEWPAHEAGLDRMDRITRVNSTAIPADNYAEARATLREAFASIDNGERVTLGFVRPEGSVADDSRICNPDEAAGGFVPCTVNYAVQPLPQSDFLTFFVFPFVTALVALAVGVTLFVMRRDDNNSLLITIFCVSLGVFSAGTFNNGTTHTFMPAWLVYTALFSGIGLTIALTFPTRPAITFNQPVILAVPIVIAVVVAAIDLSLFINPASAYAFTIVWQLPVALALLSFVTLLGSLLYRRQYVTSSIHRDQINTGIIGVGLAVIPVFVWLLSNIALALDSSLALPFNSATVQPFFITIPVALAYSMLQYRKFDTDQALSQGVTYGLMLGALVIGYFFVVLGFKLLTQDLVRADNPFVIAATIFVIAVAFLPVRTRLQNRIDRIYFRERRDFQQQVEDFARDISTTRSFTEILKLYTARLEPTLNPRGIFIFLPDDETGDFTAHSLSQPQTDVIFGGNTDYIDYLNSHTGAIRVQTGQRWHPALVSERSRLNLLKADIIVPLRGGREDINGFVIIGTPNAMRGQYTYEELRFLENTTAQMGVSVERAQVVESLERRVRELGVLSQVSQAVNFAVEFDDLLELISAQTQKVLEAPNFYIALRDETQMYFAFFMEYNERLRERENARWNATGDLFAQIVQDGSPERLDDYVQAVANRHLNDRSITDEMKAWMGVPLVAGQTRLGVIAVGTTRTAYTYSDEQLRIFTDLGALAATSLDKARLFEETNQRARQLRALNDIARRLQSERKVDRLIPLITSSAVDILEAEAGSLLLAAEDGSGDMEFRIVVGGSGEDLVGTRVKRGHGIVGEVVETRKSVIVNNTKEDERWGGEATEDSSFSTNSIIAVPLMASNEVIGVLEVLNKKDGTPYRSEDADVLETFGGQAAIAIDNARLFQKTDEQLSLRVQELETLEKIDVELNRALELERVAEITVKWAIANTGASAGMLGLVGEGAARKQMRVLHVYGYYQEDLEGILEDDDIISLEAGIAGRVMRTKQPDIQTDVSIDPDYLPSLRGAQSQITVPILAGDVIIALLILEKNYAPPLSLLDLAFVQRLTEHAAIAIENARLYSELEFTTKAQSRYMGVGAHELKNALAPIKGWTDFLMSGMLGQITDQQENSLKVIKNNVGRAELIIQDLRDFAKMRAQELRIQPEPTSIRDIVAETLQPFTQQIEEKEQTLVNHIADKNLPDIMGDSQRLIQVMTNFVSNANKYSPEGATITLDAEIRDDDRTGTTRFADTFLIVSIADTGMGISEEDQKRMFEPYFRTKEAEESDIPGTGLGMSLTREIILQHKGDVWLESELGVGSVFYFSVPLAPYDPASEGDEEPVSEPASD